jgi:hypothetical protein
MRETILDIQDHSRSYGSLAAVDEVSPKVNRAGKAILAARFSNEERHCRRLAKTLELSPN